MLMVQQFRYVKKVLMRLRSREQFRPPPATREQKSIPRDVLDKNGPGRSRLPIQPCRACFRFGDIWDCYCANSRILRHAHHYDYNPSTDGLKSSTEGASPYYTQPLLLPWSPLRGISALPSHGSYEYSYVVLSYSTRKLGPRILSIRSPLSLVVEEKCQVAFITSSPMSPSIVGHGTFRSIRVRVVAPHNIVTSATD